MRKRSGPHRPLLPAAALASALLLTAGAAAAAEPPSPAEVFGHPVGADGRLVPYDQVVAYMRRLAEASPRVHVEKAGESTQGREMVVVAVSSADNIRNLERHRETARRLSRAGELQPAEAARLAETGKVLALVTGTIHATEVGATQMFTELVHGLATTRDASQLAWLDDVILLIMPSINPDGQVMVRDWYERFKGTEYEGGPMPWLYQPYVGHDNNRDFTMLTQAETRVVNDVLYHRWFPQVFLDEHQMGRTGPRMFVPPQADPLAPEIDSLIFRQADMLGTTMSLRLEEAGKTGVGHNMIFDSYWPGGTRNTAWWKNVTGLLTEVASARIASPVTIEPGELEGGAKGLPEYGRRSNYPSPWRGGSWRLRDVVDYELIATRALLEGCSQLRRSLLLNFYDMGRRQVEAGRQGPPYAFLVPPQQHDSMAAARLVDLLLRHGVRLERATAPFSVGPRRHEAGTVLVPADQPYRAFLLTMLRPQRYPEVRAETGGEILAPYDVTSWSLPLGMGVEVSEAETDFDAAVEPLAAAPWPQPQPLGSGAGLLVPQSSDAAYPFMNSLLEAGHPVYWLPGEGPEARIWVPAAGPAAASLDRLADESHVPAIAADRAPAGAALRLGQVGIGLYKPWQASMDEGWTRWLLEQYGFPYRSLSNEDLRSGELGPGLDLLILPDVAASIIKDGLPEDEERRRFTPPLPPPYAGGLGEEGGAALAAWVREAGGTVVALDSAADYLIELLELPVSNVLKDVKGAAFNAPGTLLRLEMDTGHPLARGMQASEAGYFASSPAFRTRPPDPRFQRRVVAAYPDDARDILVSGYLRGGEMLERRAAVVDLTVGAGRVILIGFRAQHRAQTVRTFKLLFNSLYLPGLSPVDL